jgi:hypothetical protein
MARGKYIALCEGDDFWTSPFKLQKQVAVLEEDPGIKLSVHNVEVHNYLQNRKYCLSPLGADRFISVEACILEHGNLFSTNSMVFPRECVGELPGFYFAPNFEDWPLILHLATLGQVHYFNESMSVYRQGVAQSYTERAITDRNLRDESVLGTVKMFSEFDIATKGRYRSAVEKRIETYKKWLPNIFAADPGEPGAVKISVIIPTYNGEKFLGACIESVLNQSFREWELIMINDGSTDASQNVIDHYASNNPKLKAVYQENAGILRANEAGIKQAQGDYLLIIDHDDWLHPQALEILYETAVAQDADIVNYNYYQVEGDRATISSQPSIALWSKLYKKDFLMQLDFEDFPSICYYHDCLVSFLSQFYSPKTVHLDKHLYFYRMNTESATHKLSDRYGIGFLQFL